MPSISSNEAGPQVNSNDQPPLCKVCNTECPRDVNYECYACGFCFHAECAHVEENGENSKKLPDEAWRCMTCSPFSNGHADPQDNKGYIASQSAEKTDSNVSTGDPTSREQHRSGTSERSEAQDVREDVERGKTKSETDGQIGKLITQSVKAVIRESDSSSTPSGVSEVG